MFCFYFSLSEKLSSKGRNILEARDATAQKQVDA